MATEIKMPKLGIDMVEGSISKWLKQEGEQVTKEEAIAEVETDKATVDLPAPADGVLLKIIVPEDELVPVGAPIAYLGAAGESVPEGAAAGGAEGAAATTGEAEDAREAQLKHPEPSATEGAESENRTPPPARDGEIKASPVARRLAEEEGIDLSTLKGSGPGGRINKEDVEAEIVRLTDAEPAPPGGVRASPAARRLAREKGYDIAQIPGSGPGGRIVVRDVEAFQPAAAPTTPAAAPTAPAAAAPTVAGIGAAEEVPLSRMRKRITEVLTASKAPVPHFYVTMDIDMAPAIALRKEINASLEEEGVKVSFNDLIVKAAAIALKKFPNLNTSFAGDKLVRHGDINVGIAVSTPNGLITVATRETDKLSLSELATQIRARAGRARDGKVQPDDIGGTTFTVSNLGMYGVDSFIAIITPPEAAILAVGGIREEPVVKDGQIVIGQRMKATISADHRVTDGAEAAEYMVELKKLLENPMRLML